MINSEKKYASIIISDPRNMIINQKFESISQNKEFDGELRVDIKPASERQQNFYYGKKFNIRRLMM